MTEATGREWVQRLFEAKGEVDAQACWAPFMVGQAGAIMEHGTTAQAAAAIDQLEQDADDVERAALGIARVLRDIVANARRNIEEAA